MIKKNYITKQEFLVWDYVKDKEIVDTELVTQIFPEIPNNKRNKILHNLYKKGYLIRVRKNFYYNPDNIKSLYKLALTMNPDSAKTYRELGLAYAETGNYKESVYTFNKYLKYINNPKEEELVRNFISKIEKTIQNPRRRN